MLNIFENCSGLTSVTIPNSVTSIGNYAFYGCSGLTSVTIGNSVTSIGSQSFNDCSGLTKVTLNSNAIASKSYSSSSTLRSIFGYQVNEYVLGDDVTTIGSYAFYTCYKLTSITIPNSVTSIGNEAFAGCSGLTQVTLNSNALASKSYSYDSTLGSIFGSQVKEYVLGNDVTSIGSYAFYTCSKLTSITIPNSVTSIGKYAFYGCSGLTSITIPNSVTSIGSSVFSGCSGLTSVTIPNSVTSIGDKAFYGCSGLTSVTIPKSVTSIGERAFYGCKGLTSVTIPNSVTSMGNYAFNGCKGLTSVTIGNSVTSIGERAFYGCSGLTSVTIPNSVTSIGEMAFYNCSGLTSITIPNSVTSIGEDAFYGCSGLTSVHITDIAAWCKNSFGNYLSNPLYYAHHLFMDGKEITDLVIPNSVTSIGNYAFENCSGLTSVTIPNSVTSIGQYAFYYCSGLTSVTIPNSVTSIGQYAFSYCSGLNTVTIPNSVTSIGAYAFYGCDIPEIVSKIENPFVINTNTFSDNTFYNATLYVPSGTVDKYKATVGWKKFAFILASSSESYIEINETNFPDANFRSYLRSQSCGADGKITESEIKNIAWIDVQNKGIISLKGVEFFTALKSLWCQQNQLTSLDVSKNTALKELWCSSNQLTALDVSKNTALTWLACESNQLTALDVSKNTALTHLGCSDNQLTALDVSKNTALTELWCFTNKLTTLDVSKNTALRKLLCYQNQLTALDVSQNTALTTLYCHQNQLTALDVSKNTALTILWCYSNQIKGTEMDNLINSLPHHTSDYNNNFQVYYPTDEEGNVCTTSQVAAAKAKGWTPLYYDGKQWKEYAGSEPERPSYTLTYVVDGETYKTYSIKEGATITPEPAPTKECYTFSAWSEIPKTMPAHDVTVTGSFTINKYKLIYQVDGEVYRSYEIEYGATITPEPAPTKEGYTFSAWSEIPKTMPAKDVTVTGSFAINQYTITYMINNEVFTTEKVDYGSKITPPTPQTRDGYDFAWGDYLETMPAHDVTVTGSFTINKYNLIYQVDGEVYRSYEIEYGATITPEPAPAKEGYSFSGWSEIPKTMPAKDVTVTGSFTINKYKLIYQVDGEVYRSYEIEYGATITPEPAPTKEGHTFSAWSEIPKTMPAHDVTVTGSFAINQYTITYMINNEVFTTEKVDYGSKITPPTTDGQGNAIQWNSHPTNMPAYDIIIYGTCTTGIDTIMAGEYGEVKIFSLDGKAQSKLQKGVNVVRMSNGVTKKVVVK